ncbi:MAG: hypothetical protein ABIY52_10650 [Gemmatimonadaceae bacterium]
MTSFASRLTAACAAGIVVLACGEVPTFDGGIAYITPIQLPAPAVAAGDVLRDSTGAVVPLSVLAYDGENQLVAGTAATYVVNPVDTGVHIDAAGVVRVSDSVRTVQIVGRVGARLQTIAATLDIVAQPDNMVASGTIDSLRLATASSALQVTVTGLRKGTRVASKGIIVRYRITGTTPSRTVDPSFFFFPDGLRGDLTRATDTTDASGFASRTIIASDVAGLTSIEVEATAKSLLGVPLTGSPVTFSIPVKKGS